MLFETRSDTWSWPNRIFCMVDRDPGWPFEGTPKFVPMVQINNIPAFLQIMVWSRPGDKPLSEQMILSELRHIHVTRLNELITMKRLASLAVLRVIWMCSNKIVKSGSGRKRVPVARYLLRAAVHNLRIVDTIACFMFSCYLVPNQYTMADSISLYKEEHSKNVSMWPGRWPVGWWQQAITWANVGLSSVRSFGI